MLLLNRVFIAEIVLNGRLMNDYIEEIIILIYFATLRIINEHLRQIIKVHLAKNNLFNILAFQFFMKKKLLFKKLIQLLD